jgi:hypothetical protein
LTRETELVDIEKRRTDRLRVMKAIFDASRGSESSVVSGRQLKFDVGISGRDLADACKYLQGEGLITAIYERPPYSDVVHVRGLPHSRSSPHRTPYETPYEVRITHRGIKEMEESLQAPDEPTKHFPPAVSIINIQGSVIGSAIQSGSPVAQQELSIGNLDLGVAREFLDRCDTQVADMGLPSPAAAELTAEIDTVRAQLRSPRPKAHVIRESLISAQAILESTADGTAAAGLLELLKHAHLWSVLTDDSPHRHRR